MFVYTLSGKARTSEAAARICDIFGHLLPLIQEPGYRRGVCAIATDDPRRVVIQEHWGSLASLQAWLRTEAHANAVKHGQELLEDGHFETGVYRVLSGGPD